MNQLPKIYDPAKYEDAIYRQWEDSGWFNPDICIEKGITKKDATPFSIILPPPNVTGTLHLGHAAMLAIEDVLVRFHRMRGFRTLWLPGTDHAAIATQEKVERLLWIEEKKTRHDLGREVFLNRVRDFAQNSHNTIVNQCKKMGSSLDWSREAFTLDAQRNRAVNVAFKAMYDDGIIYRGDRIVNWDPKMQTTVSDDEIIWKEETIPFYYFQYGPFIIGTSRPETKFGDKYVVVHPNDERYAEYKHGQTFEVEWIGDKKITATLIKDSVVDPKFGSGAMTITPWHDATDFEIAEKHNLDKEQIIDYTGKLLPIAGEFADLDIQKAREKIVEKLKKKNLLVSIEENYIHNVATNSRGGGLIEPQIKRQWFINVNKTFIRNGERISLKSLMQSAVRNKEITIIPERFEKTYFHWVDNLRDWCISRQIWYGHRVPVWYQDEKIYCDITAPNEDGWQQDPDTLDTWFSSGIWTFSTLGWPEETKDFHTYHPTSLLETGYDILFFWVARMILMSTYLLDEIPFKTVYLHGLVRDEQGRKMSKSLGNVIDPLDVSLKYGTDAVRLSLLIGSSPGNDLKLSEEKIASYRNFTNKLWNIARFITSRTSVADNKTYSLDNIQLDSSKFILTETESLIEIITKDLEIYRFSQAGEKLRDFTWNVFADWYVEISKFETDQDEVQNVLLYVFETLLKLWHPFMPFVTETIWKEMGHGKNNTDMLMVTSWPNISETPHTKSPDSNFALVMETIKTIRNLRSEYRIEISRKVPVIISTNRTETKELLKRNIHLIIALRTNISELSIETNIKPKEMCISQTVNANINIFIPQKDAINVEKEHARIEKEIANLSHYHDTLLKRLNNPAYIENAPEKLVEQTKRTLEETKRKLQTLEKTKKDFS